MNGSASACGSSSSSTLPPSFWLLFSSTGSSNMMLKFSSSSSLSSLSSLDSDSSSNRLLLLFLSSKTAVNLDQCSWACVLNCFDQRLANQGKLGRPMGRLVPSCTITTSNISQDEINVNALSKTHKTKMMLKANKK